MTNENAPYAWEEIEAQVRKAVLCQLSILQTFGPWEPKMFYLFAGLDTEDLDEVADAIDLSRHSLHRIARHAYGYAYQTEAWHLATGEDYHEVCCGILSGGYPQADAEGEPSPLYRPNDQPLLRMFETFVARWKLSNPKYHAGLSVRELSLLSNMTVPAVRTSLSKEGFKLEANYRADAGKDENGVLPEHDALVWLSRRRGFVPTRSHAPTKPTDQSLGENMSTWLHTLPFVDALAKIMSATGNDPAPLADSLIVDQDWMAGLVSGRPVEIDVNVLRRLARYFGAEESLFVGRAVQALIRLEQQAETTDSAA
ncbi:hypothetical protein [Paragemmobacter straminiformis]|uniref:Uncharacterized protein n=1 Tax=Paragemmobacter straminiformis TaxID=2045119 RepID=A0A842I4L3_9RHOB|nr:hypothetical protein [Gemmobacter straminiformis]MBC2834074.1 hypothetical protein [Gemmobacter straminiformis]